MFETTDELLQQIRLGEDSALELKDLRYKGNQVNDPHRSSMADELAAMANTATGVFVLGVDDKSRTVVGIPEDKLDVVETWIRGICNDLITPQLFCRIRKIPVLLCDDEGRVIIRIDIPKSLYVHQSPGGYFHRIGSSKRQMTPDVLARLFQQRSQARIIRFDEQSVMTAPRNCLEKILWSKFKTPLSPSDDEEFLLKLKLLTPDDDEKICPSVSGVLMASKQPQVFLSNAFIQAVAYRGTERNADYQLDAKDIEGPLDVQIAEAYKFVERNMQVYAVKEPARHDIPQYAMESVFEALVNAVAHRDYSIQGSKIRLHMFADRLEIFSPGTIPNTMTIDSLPLRQAARNELLTSLLARCPLHIETFPGNREFLMDKRGEGVPIILSRSEELSGRRPEYALIDNSELMLTIFAAPSPEKV
ncbi:MAG: putative DNA binding domain-containing protein [Deltaproteobacteria bacterium]|nr:putative DNA binding domain-containing protein [Candidatus Tharpella aukensis]